MKTWQTKTAGVAALICGSLLATSTGYAQLTGSQDMKVVVPSVLSITAPVAAICENHDETDADFALSTQQWVANCNGAAGATVIFSLDQPFTNMAAPAFKRDARITVSLDVANTDSVATWLVAAPVSISTDYDLAIPLNTVSVAAASILPGVATFNVTVEFVTDDYSTLPSGTYATCVSAIITAN